MPTPLDALWPAVTDDSGSGGDGTVVGATLLGTGSAGAASIKAAIAALIFDPLNPTVTPATIINEVITARGSMPSLNGRLSVSLNPDGTLITPAGLGTLGQIQSQLAASNVAVNADLASWSLGAALAPDGWALSGAGAAVARTGAGEADTFSFLAGVYAAKVTFGAASAKLTQQVVTAADMSAKFGSVKSRKISVGCFLKSSIANHVRIVVDDGITTTASAYHTGGGSAEFIAVTHSVSASGTKIDVYVEVAQAGAAYMGGFNFAFSDVAPSRWSPYSELVRKYGDQEVWDVKSFRATPKFNIGAVLAAAYYGKPMAVINTGAADVTPNITTQFTLASATVPVSVLTTNGQFIEFEAHGKFANNANTKVINVKAGNQGGLVDIFTYSGADNNRTWSVYGRIYREGASLQRSYVRFIVGGSAPNTAAGAAIGQHREATQDSTVLTATLESGASYDVRIGAINVTAAGDSTLQAYDFRIGQPGQ